MYSSGDPKKINQALAHYQTGGMVIVMDDESRENEGDLVMAASAITPEAINFMSIYGRGLICLALTAADVLRLQLPMQPVRNRLAMSSPFTVSIDACEGITTGISAFERAHTIQTVINPLSGPESISTPGHIFPLRAHPDGLASRRGHTEASIHLSKLTNQYPAAVICEIMNADGTMARRDDLADFSKKFQLPLLTIEDLCHDKAKAIGGGIA